MCFMIAFTANARLGNCWIVITTYVYTTISHFEISRATENCEILKKWNSQNLRPYVDIHYPLIVTYLCWNSNNVSLVIILCVCLYCTNNALVQILWLLHPQYYVKGFVYKCSCVISLCLCCLMCIILRWTCFGDWLVAIRLLQWWVFSLLV